MSKKIIRLFIVSFILCLTAVCFIINANAASASIWYTDPTVTVGSNVSITVDIKGEDMGGYEASITYDSAYLTFVSATSGSGNFSYVNGNGVIKILDYMSSGATTKMSCRLTFATKKTGTTKLNTSNYEFTGSGGDVITPYSVGDSTINIIPVPEASGDATLKGLTIGSGTLTPAFSANVTQYTAEVDYSVTSLTVTALKNHNGASVYVGGNDPLAVGENTVSITVTAENGAKQVYYIKVIRGKNPLSTDVFVTVGEEINAEVANTISDDIIPKGFEKTKVTLNGVEIDALVYDARALPLIFLIGNENVTEGLYFADVANMTAKPIEYLGQATQSLTILDVNMAEIPDGYVLGKMMFGETEREVLVPIGAETPNHCLVYAIGASGEKTLYMYDPLENTYQRYNFAEMGENVETEPEQTELDETSPEKTPETEKQSQNNDKSLFANGVFRWIFIGLVVLIVALVVVAIVLGVKYN